MEILTPTLAVGFAITTIIGFVLYNCEREQRKEERLQAARAGVAGWVVNAMTGSTDFRYVCAHCGKSFCMPGKPLAVEPKSA